MIEGEVENAVLVGRNGWLFLWEGSNEVARYYTEPDFFSEEAKAEWRRVIAARVERLASLGVRYVHIVVPDKLTILSEHVTLPMPHLASAPSKWFKEDFQGHDYYLDLHDAILDHPQKEEAFYQTDSHWTALGAGIAYKSLCSRLAVNPVDFSDRKVVGGDMVFDLGKKLAALPKERARFCMVLRDATRIAENRLVRFNESPPPRDGPVKLVGTYVVFRNATAADVRKVMIFGDSYSEYRPYLLTGMLAETFREVHFIWSTSVDFALVEKLQPDIVITEIAERFVNVVPKDATPTVID